MISKLRHKLGVSSITALICLCVYFFVMCTILLSALIYWWLPVVIIPLLVIMYLFSHIIVSAINVVNKINGIIIEYIFFKVGNEKN